MNHQGKTPNLILDIACSRAAGLLQQGIRDAGYWTVQSFDLRSTRAIHEGCTCPNHGTSQCTCELVVLLVYGTAGLPLTLILDGRDGQTYLFIAEAGTSAEQQAAIESLLSVIQAAVTIQLE